MYLRVFTAAVLMSLAAGTAHAQAVSLQFDAGQVTLSARNAPLRAILQEWARLGGATIVNADRVAGPPVTLELTAVPERQALDIVLRSVAGYIVAPRPVGSPGASAFDRIMILPTSVAPANPPPAAAAAGRPRLPIVRPGIVRPPDAGDLPVDEPPADPLEDPSALVQGRDPRVVQPPFVIRPPAAEDTGADDTGEQPAGDDAQGTGPTAANPFGVPAGSSATPGVISTVPQVRTPRVQPRVPTNRVQ